MVYGNLYHQTSTNLPPDISIYGTIYHRTSNNPPPDTSIYGIPYHPTSNNPLPTHRFMELLTTRHHTIPRQTHEFMELFTTRLKQSSSWYISLWNSLPPDIKQSPPDTSIYGTLHHQTIPYNHINLWNSLPPDIKQSPSRHINLWNNFPPDIKQHPLDTSIYLTNYHTTSIYGKLCNPTLNNPLQTYQFCELFTTRHQTIPFIHINLWNSLPYDIKQSPSHTSLYGSLYHPASNNYPPDI